MNDKRKKQTTIEIETNQNYESKNKFTKQIHDKTETKLGSTYFLISAINLRTEAKLRIAYHWLFAKKS